MGVTQSKQVDISSTPKKKGETNGTAVQEKITVRCFLFIQFLPLN